jgi:hypothetical protein
VIRIGRRDFIAGLGNAALAARLSKCRGLGGVLITTRPALTTVVDMTPIGKRVLWGVETARTMRPHWALHELSIPYETRPILSRSSETQALEFSLINPPQKIPVLQDGDFTVAESGAIVSHVAASVGWAKGRRQEAGEIGWCKSSPGKA